ncbi:MAG: exonuclease SbcCD subunit D [Methanocalculaceae archaeon]|jgi:exonuclease SbcD|nr:exonuclease SbcCD subunit D [Methanocalculaceae archaeon]
MDKQYLYCWRKIIERQSMKFLHLSDLHIGKSVNGFPMLEEQRHIFAQAIGHIQTEKPDAVLIAGDIYDRTVPSVEAVRLFDDFLTRLAKEGVTVLLISGNHDSPERLNYASRLLAERNLYLCGVFDGKLQSVTLSDGYGEVNFWLLPFVKPSTIRSIFCDTEIDDSYTDAVSMVLKTAAIDYTARNVLLSHQYYTAAGVTHVLSESEINPVGGLGAVDSGLLSLFDYAALGHLHGAHDVDRNVRYAGSPLKYSFSECRQEKSATLVVLKKKATSV